MRKPGSRHLPPDGHLSGLSSDGQTTGRGRDVDIRRVYAGNDSATVDVVAVEEPLEVRLGYTSAGSRVEKSISITMRTPGNDDELAVGFLFTEGILESPDQVLEVWHRGPPVPGDSELRNVIRVDLADDVAIDLDRLARHFYTTSSCGVCGKASLDALRTQGQFMGAVASSPFAIASDVLVGLPEKLVGEQEIFGKTGGLHASALFDRDGSISHVREDVGRHNALDKLIGRLFLDAALPAENYGIIVSGRASFELVQKAAMAGAPMLAAVGAPSSLAVEVAREFDMTLVGFLRGERFNVYSGQARI